MRNRSWALTACLALGAAGVVSGGLAWAAKPIEHLSAFAVDMSNLAPRARAGTVDILIERWTTDEERDRLVAALREGGNDGLKRELEKIKDPVGYIRSPGSLGFPLRFAREIPLPGGGRRILIATDRPVSFLEMRNQPRTLDYPFMFVDIRMNANGEGEGKLLPLARVNLDSDHVVEIENYASEPIRLTSVKRVS